MTGESTNSLKLQLATAFAEGRAVHQWATQNGLPSRTDSYSAEDRSPRAVKKSMQSAERHGILPQPSANMCDRDPSLGSQAPPLTSKSVECELSSRFDRANAPNTDEPFDTMWRITPERCPP